MGVLCPREPHDRPVTILRYVPAVGCEALGELTGIPREDTEVEEEVNHEHVVAEAVMEKVQLQGIARIKLGYVIDGGPDACWPSSIRIQSKRIDSFPPMFKPPKSRLVPAMPKL